MRNLWLAGPLLGCATAFAACATENVTPPLPSGAAAPLAPAPPASTAAADPAPPVAGRDLPSDEALIARMLKRVETARGLTATKAVPGVRLPRAELIAHVKAHVARELPGEAIRNEGLTLQLFGFVPTQFDYEAAEYHLLEEQLAGYYEPADGTMYMASDLPDDEASATLAHELVHALQDQHWDLESRSKYRAGAGDLMEAVSALAEGDATSAMFDVMIERAAPGMGKTAADIPDDLFVSQIREGMTQGFGSDAPAVMRTSLVAPYVYGTLFVNRLRRRGRWDAVNRAWENAPVTSEQILHIDKWDTREPALKVPPPTFAALGAGWHSIDEDSEGELGTRIAFEQWMEPALAAKTSEGWGGDRGVLLADGDLAAFAWRLRYDPGHPADERAARAFQALGAALGANLGPAASSDAAFTCRERKDRGPMAIARDGADLLFVLGPARAAGPAWASAGDCALARRWTREIAAHRAAP
jgi:hypothetical protein